MAVDPRAFRDAMARFASGVTVVTTVDGERRFGLTASSFISVSLEPPLVLVCLAKKLYTHEVIERSGVFAVNILGAHQLELGMQFAGMKSEMADRFEGIATTVATTGAPLLDGSLASIDCRLWNRYEGGDHSLFVGEVQDIVLSNQDAPLLYHNRLWRRSEAITTPSVPLDVTISEVGPAEGLPGNQGLPQALRLASIEGLLAAGLENIRVGAFVGPEVGWASAFDVSPGLSAANLSALIEDERGVVRAQAQNLKQVDIRMGADPAAIPRGLIRAARDKGLRVLVEIGAAFGTPESAAKPLASVVRAAREAGADEVRLIDSAGCANPQQVRRVAQELGPLFADFPLSFQFSDARAMGLANLLSALKSGATRFATSFGGYSGARSGDPGRSPLATEDAVTMLREMEIETHIDAAAVAGCSQRIETLLGHSLPGKLHRRTSGL